MWELDCEEGWAPKNWCLQTMVLEKPLRVPWTARKSNQSILKESGPCYSLEGLMLKLKLQYFGHLMWRIDSFEKTLMLGKIESRRRRDDRGWDGWMASRTRWTWVWVNPGRWCWTGRPGVLWFTGSQRVRHDWVIELNHKVGVICLPVAVATAMSLQSCLTLCDPIDSSQPGSSVPGILQAQILEWVAISFSTAYLRLLIFLQQSWFQLVLHPAYRFSWCTLYIS